MAISTVGGGYRFLPPVIRPDPEAASGTPPDSSHPVATAAVQSASAVPAQDAAARQGSMGRHLLRVLV